MKNNKLISLLQTFTKEEFKELGRFVQSPLYNKHEGVIQLFAYLRKQIEGRKKPFSLEKLLLEMFPDGKGDSQDLHYLNSYLLKVAEQYLAWAEWQKEEKEWGIYLLRAYQKRGLEKPFLQTLKKASLQHQKQDLRNATYFRQKYALEWEEHSYSVAHGRQKGFNLQNLSNTHDKAFLAEKLKIACILLSHQAVAKTEYDTGILDAVLKYVEERGFEETPAIAINYYSYLALTDFEDSHSFHSLKDHIINKSDHFTIDELKDAHLNAINCCIRRLNSGKREYLREAFDLYQSGLRHGVFLTNGLLSPWTYSNITVSGLKLNEYEWVYEFIHQFQGSLPEGQREGFFNYNLARYFFEQKDYPQAMPLFLQVETNDILHNLSAKTMLMKMYYELDELDALDNLLSSFKTYIYRKKVLGYHRDNYLSIISLMQKLVGVNPYSKEEKEKLQVEIAEAKVTEKEWLLEQLGEK